MAAWLYKSNQKVHSLVHYLISCVRGGRFDYIIDWLKKLVSCFLCEFVV